MRKDVYLEELIQILEKEKKVLKKIIDEHLKVGDYRIAHKYSKGLGEVSSKLRVLYLFQDPYKDRRNILARKKKSLTESLEMYKGDEALTNFFLDELNRFRNERNDADDMKLGAFQETQYIDDALYDVAGGVIKSFQLVFKEDGFDMKFERQPDDILCWSIGPIKPLYKARLQWKKNRRALESLGFALPANEDRYVYRYDLSNFKNALPLKQLLARVIYDAFTRWYPYDTPKVELHRDG